ncbi:MAG: hypothetical protein UZ17_ACD001001965 [Acidobacteria bacterium OLB17]|nr:MAG: hypothetical protein UZ17_ACD001001965 [Acidobacteria bacterium OLB17]MCZ2390156.1 DUF2752 domain-containing protein [Acidobacteriota bacterium]
MNVLALEDPSMLTRASAVAGAGALGVGSLMVAAFDPSKAHFFPVCPLLALTGIACPGCGLTRAFHALFHGDIVTALDFNLLVPVWAVAFAWTFVSLLLFGFRKKGLPMWPTDPRFVYGFFAVLLVFGVLRNIPAWPLTILYP